MMLILIFTDFIRIFDGQVFEIDMFILLFIQFSICTFIFFTVYTILQLEFSDMFLAVLIFGMLREVFFVFRILEKNLEANYALESRRNSGDLRFLGSSFS